MTFLLCPKYDENALQFMNLASYVSDTNKPCPRLVHFAFYKWKADLHKQSLHLMPVHVNQSRQYLTVIIHTFTRQLSGKDPLRFHHL